MLRPRKRPNLLNYVRLKDFAASAGVTERAVQAWLAKPKIDPEIRADIAEYIGQPVPKAHKREFESFLKDLKQTHPNHFRRLRSNRTKCMSYGIVYKGRAYISLQGAERFMENRGLPRVNQRPRDSVTVQAAVDMLPYGKWKIYRAAFAGEIEAVIYSQTIYLDKESVKRYELKQKSLLPLPGWIMVREGAKEANRSYTSLKKWLTLHKKPMRIFLHPEANRPSRYMRQTDLSEYLELTTRTDKHIPKQ